MAIRASVLFIVAGICAGLAQPASAQWWGGNYPSYHASTPAEGYLNGMGSLVQSAGAANLMNSMAAQNYQGARSMELDNRLKSTETYFQMRQVNFEARQAERDRLRTRSASDMPRQAGPPRATASQINPSTGQINWPPLLEASEFSTARDSINTAFAQRAETGHLVGDPYLSAQQTIQGLQDTLRANIRNFPPNSYIQSQRFLEMLAFEVQMPNG